MFYNVLVDLFVDCNLVVVVVGGGVVGDVVGFIVVIYVCGICYVQVFMILLVQVDSFVGGKVVVNYLWVKNLIGVFY